MTLTFSLFDFSQLSRILRAAIGKPKTADTPVKSDDESSRAERALMREMLFNNCEGVQSDLGLMEIMARHARTQGRD